MRFFVRNFGGRPAQCFRREHVDGVIDTLVDSAEVVPGFWIFVRICRPLPYFFIQSLMKQNEM
jgi:hypothetical protein